MTSKACFSKPAGFFRQLTAKQLWLFALWSVFLLFLYPLSGMMEFSDGWEYTALYDLQRHVDRSFLTRTTAVLYMMPVLAIVFSSCFGYLNSRQKLDFYHAQPVTRTRLFFTNYASGAFHFVVPYLVMHTLAFVLMNSVTGFYQPELRLLLYPMLYTLGMFFIFYSLMVLFRMVCGNTVIAVLSYGFMTNLPAIAYFLYQVYVGRWSNLYMSSAATESGMRLTPYTLLGSPMSVKVEPSGAYAFVTDIDWTALVVWVVAALAAAAGAVLLYKVRPSEKAGSAVAVRGVLPVIKYPLVVCASLLGGIFFAASTGHAFVWEIIGYLLFGLLAQGLTRIDGLRIDDVEPLLQLRQTGTPIGLRGLLVGGIVISALGAVMDVTMGIASSLSEVHAANPELSRRELFRSGMNIGRDMVGTMTNTLILAFLGSGFTLILYLYSLGLSPRQLLSSAYVSLEVVSGVASSVGVILSIPLTALITAEVFTREKKSGKSA